MSRAVCNGAGHACLGCKDTVVFKVCGAVEWEDLSEAEGSESPTVDRDAVGASVEAAELADRSLLCLEEWA